MTSDEDGNEKVQSGDAELAGKVEAGKREQPADYDTEYASYEEVDETSSSFAEVSRSQRKRDREKKRRGDLNNGLDRMLALVFMIDPELKAEAEERARKNQGTKTTNTENPMLNRLELINNAVAILERIHRENEELKMIVAHLARELAGMAPQPTLPPHIMAPLPNAREIQVSIPYRISHSHLSIASSPFSPLLFCIFFHQHNKHTAEARTSTTVKLGSFHSFIWWGCRTTAFTS